MSSRAPLPVAPAALPGQSPRSGPRKLWPGELTASWPRGTDACRLLRWPPATGVGRTEIRCWTYSRSMEAGRVARQNCTLQPPADHSRRSLTRLSRRDPSAPRRAPARDALPPGGGTSPRGQLRDAHEHTSQRSPSDRLPPARRGRFRINGRLLVPNGPPAALDESAHRSAGGHCRACAHEHPRCALLSSFVHSRSLRWRGTV